MIGFYIGTSLYQHYAAHKVETYLLSQGDKKAEFQSIEVWYDFKFGYMVDIIYKDEPYVIYTYRYQGAGDTGEKRVLFYYETLLNKTLNPDTYAYKHKYFRE